MSISQLEIDARQQAVADLLKQYPDISDDEGASRLHMGASSFRRYKDKIRKCYSNALESAKNKSIQKAYKELKTEVENLRSALQLKDEELKKYASIADMRPVSDIKLKHEDAREVVPVLVASDWHIEETVSAAITNGLNEYNLKIAEDSVRQFFSKACKKVCEAKGKYTVNTVVLAVLGDIINGVLRAEDLESNQTTSVDAIALARSLMHKGIQMIADETHCNIRVLCCVGNHGRLTEKIHYSNQVHQSLEYLLYKTLEHDFRDSENISVVVSEAPYIIQPIFGVKVRFHHGHAARFNGGIGGLAVPVIRKTQQMNTIEHADLDVIGHFHSAQTFSNVIVNGSLVGSNGFSMSLGLPHDIPKQTYFEIDSKYGRTVVAPICIDREVKKTIIDSI